MRQKELKLFFNPRIYPYKTRRVRLKETYISWLFLTGNYVYKIKKPVKFSYLDFSTLPKREFFLKEELRLNKKISPDIYLDVVPIVKEGNRFRIMASSSIKLASGQKIIDYALLMKEIPESSYAPNLIKRNEISRIQIDKLAKMIADFHRKIVSSPEIQKYGSLKTIKQNWNENFRNTKKFIGRTIRWPIFKFIKEGVGEFIKKNEKLFGLRLEKNKIKDCHGDFHTGNIFITPSKIHIIDCVEFNKRFRFGDTASDIAFLLMDLEFLGRNDLSDYFLKRYKFYSEDASLLKVLDFYKCYRAYIRGKVLNFSLDSSNNLEEKLREAKKYFSLAFQYAMDFSKSKPYLLVIFGNVGTGKTCLAKHLSEATGFIHLRSDIIRKNIFKIPIFFHKKREYKTEIYSESAAEKVYGEMEDRALSMLAKNKSVILDASFGREIFRKEAIKSARKLKIPYFFIECSLPEKVILERLKKREEEKEVSDADMRIYLKKREEFDPIKISRRHYFKINTGQNIDSEIDDVLRKILKLHG